MAEAPRISEVADDCAAAVVREQKAGNNLFRSLATAIGAPRRLSPIPDDYIWSDRLLKEARILRRMGAARWNKSRREPLLSDMEFSTTKIIAWSYRPRFTRTVHFARELQAILDDTNLRKAAPTLSGSTFTTWKKSGFQITRDQTYES